MDDLRIFKIRTLTIFSGTQRGNNPNKLYPSLTKITNAHDCVCPCFFYSMCEKNMHNALGIRMFVKSDTMN